LGVTHETRPPRLGIWGRKGQLAAFGVAVRQGVSYHGTYINVNPAMNPFGYIDTALTRVRETSGTIASQAAAVVAAGTSSRPTADGGTEANRPARATMSCLLAETGRGVTMPRVRAQLIASLSEVFGCDRHHLHTGHPLLTALNRTRRDPISRAC
jgi:lipoate-protein ligase B